MVEETGLAIDAKDAANTHVLIQAFQCNKRACATIWKPEIWG